jgi:serine/threonine-protein kinase
MLTGSDPQDNPLLIFDFSKNPRPRQINPGISAEMERILMKAVAHKPEDRQASALELMRELEAHRARIDPRAKASRPPGGLRPSSLEVPPLPVPHQPVQRASAVDRPATPPVAPIVAPAAPPAGTPGSDWVFCGHCGERIGSDDVYCAHCGERQPVAGGAAAGYPAKAGSGRITAQLTVVGTEDMIKPFIIDKESVLIGRTDPHTSIFPEIDLTMHDPETKVSRRHARIYRQGEQFLIEDLGSVNGTIINSVNGGSIRLNQKSPRVLTAGDEVKLGGTVLKFTVL